MAKHITFTYEGMDYVLEFTRKSIETMERGGFMASDIRDKPMLTLPALFEGAFLAHHRFTKKEKIHEIYDHITNRTELISTLAELYNAPIAAMMDEPEESEANFTWKAE